VVEISAQPARVEALRAVPLLADLSDDALVRLASVATEVEVPAGFVLVRAGDDATGMFLVEEGSVAVELPGGKTFTLGQGEFFGELALLVEGLHRTARVRAATPLRCIAIARADVARLLEEEPGIALSMLRVLAARLAERE
jgi:CRP-like cAMP-binding protein